MAVMNDDSSICCGGAETPEPMPTELAQQAQQLHRSVAELIRIVQFRDRDRICCHDITVSQCYALEAICCSPPLTLNELAERLYLDKSTTSRLVDGLVAGGWAERLPHPQDGRALLLRVTGKGARLFEQIEADLVAESERILADIDPQLRAALVPLVARLVQAAANRIERGNGCCRLRD